MKKLKNNKQGFTLIEMIVVIVIIAILAAIAVPAIMKYIDDAKETKLIAQGHGSMTTVQASLTKAEAKSSTGGFSSADVTAATEEAKADNGNVTGIQICTNDIKEPTGSASVAACTAPDLTASKGKVNAIKTYIVEFADGKVYVPVSADGAAFFQ